MVKRTVQATAAAPNDLRQVTVTPTARAHGLGFSALGLVIFAVTAFLWLSSAPIPTAAFGLLYLTSAVLLFLGSAKIIEPPISLEITPQTIRYCHRRGHWQVHWDNIVRYDVPRVQHGLEFDELPYIGFALRDIEPIITTITPRLAVNLLTEQRHLLVVALRHERPDIQDYSPYFEVPDRFAAASGKIYTGVQAMFATRCAHFRELLGYDLFIPVSALDRPPDDFLHWLKQLESTRTITDIRY